MQYIEKISLKKQPEDYTRKIPAVKRLDLELTHPVTFFVGENGSGKSTVLEAIAVAYGFNPEGGSLNFSFSTCDSHSGLWECIRLGKSPYKAKDGWFLRAESFYNAVSYIDELSQPGMGTPIVYYYGGISLHEKSHGESFFAMLMNRLGGKGVYIFDEPEAALSAERQMSLLVKIHDLVKKDSQFIIATHSPILTAYPDSEIYLFDNKGISKTEYRKTDAYIQTKNFLNNTDKMLKYLLED